MLISNIIMAFLSSSPRIRKSGIFCPKFKNLYFFPNIFFDKANLNGIQLGIFELKLEKLLLYLKSTHPNLSNCKIWCKNKCQFGTKNALIECIGEQSWKTLVIFQLSALELALLQMLVRNQKSLNLGPKMPDLFIFGLEFENTIFILEINQLEFVFL